MSTDQKCSNDIYSEMNYEKVRQDNLKKTSELYQKLLTEYSGKYSNYLQIQSAAIGNPSDTTLKNDADMAAVKNKPEIIQLNKKLVDIESALLDNNKIIHQDIQEQRKQLELDNEEKKIIYAKVDKLDKIIKTLEDYNGTGFYSVDDINKQFEVTTFWYYFLLVVNFIIFITFCIFFYLILSADTS